MITLLVNSLKPHYPSRSVEGLRSKILKSETLDNSCTDDGDRKIKKGERLRRIGSNLIDQGVASTRHELNVDPSKRRGCASGNFHPYCFAAPSTIFR